MENVFLFKHAANLNTKLQLLICKNNRNTKHLKAIIMREVMQSFKELDEDLTDRLMDGTN